MGLLDGKKALITGARKGIGRGIALTLANEGADVGVNDIVDDAVSLRAAELVTSRGVRGTFHAGDVSTVAGINSVIDSFLAEHGQIDILVNNAIFPDQSRPLFDTDEVFWDRIMDLSLKGYFFGSQRAAKEMIAQSTGGRIVLSCERPRLCRHREMDRVWNGESCVASDGQRTGRRPVRSRHHGQLHRAWGDFECTA